MGEILTGDYFSFNAVKGDKARIGIKNGKSEQKTRSGKNIFDINTTNVYAFNASYKKTDTVISVTRIDSTGTSRVVFSIYCKANTDYILTLNYTSQDTTTNGSNVIGIRTSSGSGDWLGQKSIYKDVSQKRSFELEFNSGNYTTVYLWLYLSNLAGSDGSIQMTYEDIMIREASVEDDSYEAYGAMPSPKFVSPINNIEGSINLFDGELEKGSINYDSGLNEENENKTRSKNYIELPSNILKFKVIRTIVGNEFWIRFYDKDKKYLGYDSASGNYNKSQILQFNVLENTKYIRFVDLTNNLSNKIKITVDLLSYKYTEPNKGIIFIKNTCKNLINQDEIGNYNSGISYISTLDDNSKKTTANLSNSRDAGTFLKLKKNTQYIVSLDIISITTENGIVKGAVEIMGHKFNTDTNIFGTLFKQTTITSASIGQRFSTTFNSGDYDFWTLHISGWYGSGFSGVLIYKNVQVEEGTEATDFVDGSQEFEFPLQEGQALREGDYLASDGIHHKRKQVLIDLEKFAMSMPFEGLCVISNRRIYLDYIGVQGLCNYFKNAENESIVENSSARNYLKDNEFNVRMGDTKDRFYFKNSAFTTLEQWQDFFNNNEVIVEYECEEYIEPYTPEQQTIRNLMQNVVLYEGTNNIFCTNEITPTLEVETSKLIDDFDFYISSNGYLVFPQYNKKYLTNMSENVILNMPEAVQTTVKIAGKDGDLVLDSSYNSQDFQVVMFTDEGLIPEQKEKERIFINRIFNAMKKNSKTFAFEQSQKFYKVLYSGILEETNYPQHMMFTIPLKSSKPYAYKMSSSYLLGNDTKTSETIEPTGFTCTIYGPALNPIISLNDYSMEFSNTILEGEKLIIDTNNSTAVLVNSNGIETNAMRYYNHQFPKIMEGENVLKVLSGIDNPNNVFISWYDLTL